MPKYKFEGYFVVDGERQYMTIKGVKVKDDAITGHGHDPELGAFTIEGSIDGKGMEFVQSFEENEDAKRVYRGYVNSKRTKSSGQWAIGDEEETGDFKLKAVNDPQDPKLKIVMNGIVMWRKKGEWIEIGQNCAQL